MTSLPLHRRKPGLRPRTFRWRHTHKADLRSDTVTLVLQYYRRCSRRAHSKWCHISAADYLSMSLDPKNKKRKPGPFYIDREGKSITWPHFINYPPRY